MEEGGYSFLIIIHNDIIMKIPRIIIVVHMYTYIYTYIIGYFPRKEKEQYLFPRDRRSRGNG